MAGTNTIADALVRCNNRPAGFDYMRVILASAVVVSHTVNVVYGPAAAQRLWDSPARPLVALILPMFFTLSGFLVAGSLERCTSMVSFLGLRVIRLVPGLAVDTLIAAFVIGPLFTNLPLHEYFSSTLVHRYFLNIVGDIHFLLPGVFESNPQPRIVNGQLWTLPFELLCYGSLTAFAIAGLTRHRGLFLAAACLAIVAAIAVSGLKQQGAHIGIAGPILMVGGFLIGVAAYLWRDRIVLDRRLFLVAVVGSITCTLVPRMDIVLIPFVVYLTVYLGMTNPRRSRIVSSGDYSYGIFLYGYPVQQAVAALLGPTSWYVHLPISYALVLAIAAASWWWVEAPALKLRPGLYALEKRVIDWSQAVPLGRFFTKAPMGPRLRRPPARKMN